MLCYSQGFFPWNSVSPGFSCHLQHRPPCRLLLVHCDLLLRSFSTLQPLQNREYAHMCLQKDWHSGRYGQCFERNVWGMDQKYHTKFNTSSHTKRFGFASKVSAIGARSESGSRLLPFSATHLGSASHWVLAKEDLSRGRYLAWKDWSKKVFEAD